MRKIRLILPFMVIWVFLTTFALVWRFSYDWPDFVHVDYGIPLTWATNTLSTIAGPANLWNINVPNLVVDILFWQAIMIAAVSLMIYKIKDC